MEPQIRYARTSDGVNIAYYVMGEGDSLVFASAILWNNLRYGNLHQPEYARVGHGIGRGMRSVRYDARGTGLSDQSSMDYTIEARLRDLSAIVDASESQQVHLFGAMHGAATAIAYAAAHPERVSRLVLYMPYAVGADYKSAASRFDSFRDRAYDDPKEWEEYTLAIAAANFGYGNPDVIEAAAQRFRDSMTPASLRAFWDSVGDIDVRSSLINVKSPTLVIYRGESFSTVLTLEMARSVAAGISSSTFVHTTGTRGIMWSDDETAAVERFLGIPRASERYSIASAAIASDRGSGTAIILFADIVDSTALTERMGDAAFRDRARSLDTSLRTIITDVGGTAIEGKLLGDGVLATFPAASQAIDAALRCAAAGDEQSLPLHLGLHAGDVIREQNNVFGGAVNIASRISGLSAPGEVLVSDVVRALARTSAAVTFEDRGEHALKGVGDPQRVYAVRASRSRDGASP
jgi:class 3 adenylate cyclase